MIISGKLWSQDFSFGVGISANIQIHDWWAAVHSTRKPFGEFGFTAKLIFKSTPFIFGVSVPFLNSLNTTRKFVNEQSPTLLMPIMPPSLILGMEFQDNYTIYIEVACYLLYYKFGAGILYKNYDFNMGGSVFLDYLSNSEAIFHWLEFGAGASTMLYDSGTWINQ